MLRSAFAAVLEDPASFRGAEIRIERIAGPILLVSGEDDHFWSFTAMVELAMRRGRERGFAHQITHLRSRRQSQLRRRPRASAHELGRAPAHRRPVKLRGTPATNARARIDSWGRESSHFSAKRSHPPRAAPLPPRRSRDRGPDMSPESLHDRMHEPVLRIHPPTNATRRQPNPQSPASRRPYLPSDRRVPS